MQVYVYMYIHVYVYIYMYTLVEIPFRILTQDPHKILLKVL